MGHISWPCRPHLSSVTYMKRARTQESHVRHQFLRISKEVLLLLCYPYLCSNISQVFQTWLCGKNSWYLPCHSPCPAEQIKTGHSRRCLTPTTPKMTPRGVMESMSLHAARAEDNHLTHLPGAMVRTLHSLPTEALPIRTTRRKKNESTHLSSRASLVPALPPSCRINTVQLEMTCFKRRTCTER
jgi:hypothetical protein